MATAWSRNFPTLFFFRAAEGIGETFYFPASMSLVADYHGKKTRSRAMSIHQTSVYVGTIAGSAISGYIAETQFGWRGFFEEGFSTGSNRPGSLYLGLVVAGLGQPPVAPVSGGRLAAQSSLLAASPIASLTTLIVSLRCTSALT